MPFWKTWIGSIVLALALGSVAGCKRRVVYVEGKRTHWLESGQPAPYSGYLVEKGKLLTLLKRARENVGTEAPAEKTTPAVKREETVAETTSPVSDPGATKSTPWVAYGVIGALIVGLFLWNRKKG